MTNILYQTPSFSNLAVNRPQIIIFFFLLLFTFTCPLQYVLYPTTVGLSHAHKRFSASRFINIHEHIYLVSCKPWFSLPYLILYPSFQKPYFTSILLLLALTYPESNVLNLYTLHLLSFVICDD